MNMLIVLVASILCMSDMYGMEQGYLPTEKRTMKRDQTTDKSKKHKKEEVAVAISYSEPCYHKVLCDQKNCDHVVFSHKKSNNKEKGLKGLSKLFNKHIKSIHHLPTADDKEKYINQTHWTVSGQEIKEKYMYLQCQGCFSVFCCIDSYNMSNKKQGELMNRFKTHLSNCENKDTDQQNKLSKRGRYDGLGDVITLNNIENAVNAFQSKCTAADCGFSFDSIEREHVENMMEKHIQFDHKGGIEMPIIKDVKKKLIELSDKVLLLMCMVPKCNNITIAGKNNTKQLQNLFERHIKDDHVAISADITSYIRTNTVKKTYGQYEIDLAEKLNSPLQCQICQVGLKGETNKVHKEIFEKKHAFLHTSGDKTPLDDLVTAITLAGLSGL